MSEGFVKICGVTSVGDAQLVQQLGASAVGLIVAPSKRQISAEAAAQISSAVTDIPTVLVCRQMADTEILHADEVANTTWVQLHDQPTDVLLDELSRRGRTVIRAISSDELRDAGSISPGILMIDSAMPGSGEVFEWTELARNIDVDFILAGGLSPRNVAEAITVVRPWGVDVATGVESSPGVKNPELLEAFIASAKLAFENLRRTA
jgi:phosphoribosylanthranilate isomerase